MLRRHLKILRKRLDYLQGRIDASPDAPRDYWFAERAATRTALAVLELVDEEEDRLLVLLVLNRANPLSTLTEKC